MKIYKRMGSDNWYYTASYRGRRRVRSTGTMNKRLAQKIAMDAELILVEEAHGVVSQKEFIGFKKAAEEFLDSCEVLGRSSNTMRNYRNFAGKLVTRFGNTPVNRLPENCIETIVRARKSATPPLGAGSINREVSILKLILKRHKCWSRIGEDWQQLKLPQSNGIALTEEEEARLLEACAVAKSPALLSLATLYLETGMRSSELRSLRRTDLDAIWTNGVLAHGTVATVQAGKTNSARRRVPLSARARDVLTSWLARFPDAPEDGYLFPSFRSNSSGLIGRIDWNNHLGDPEAQFVLARNRAGLGKIRRKNGLGATIHDLRHTRISRDQANPGIPESVIVSMYGHSTARETARYTHTGDENRLAALAAREEAESPTEHRLKVLAGGRK